MQQPSLDPVARVAFRLSRRAEAAAAAAAAPVACSLRAERKQRAQRAQLWQRAGGAAASGQLSATLGLGAARGSSRRGGLVWPLVWPRREFKLSLACGAELALEPSKRNPSSSLSAAKLAQLRREKWK